VARARSVCGMTGLASAVGRYLSGTSSAASAFSPKSSRARPALPARPMTTGAARIPVMLVVVQEAGERAWRVGGGLKRAQCPAHRSCRYVPAAPPKVPEPSAERHLPGEPGVCTLYATRTRRGAPQEKKCMFEPFTLAGLGLRQ
jgi:hypothetical protein